ncbi:tRNA uridine-5-carboxymethylaminomethyl(34) synthesis GTPase MnmE [Mesomycoplasma hyorhinis]|uniref:tRNA uridine-5-carboxymethylaminomethyl(34) synthesis GTPase MnmE n=1 Tax=Mesomycoplasma hyorhinis TaxID=2100 RepID=UPI001C0496A3|nr:tRNA uridine-5-carboxymethylaminomethyl(34) synthesis GTPase MnmE [Mesomycoplasma hyorhinis]
MIKDTIVAIASGQVNQAISIIRISGPEAFTTVAKIFKGRVGTTSREVTYGWIHNNGELIDEVLVLWFKGTNNFVGEDTVEINAHGGVLNTNLILELLLSQPHVRLAERGEFSRRSFLNGKMDLIKAQAIHDLIMARTKKQAQLSIKQFSGKTSIFINELINDLLNIIAIIEVNIDYPEYDDVEVLTTEVLLPKLEALLAKFEKTIEASERSRIIFEGIKVALVGTPNVGKSSLLNALIEQDKSIVSDVAGTTRDVVEASFVLSDIVFKLVDTAGVRKAKNKIEQIGIKKSLEQIEKASIVIHIIDATKQENEFDKLIQEHSKNKDYIKVYNKKDLNPSNFDANDKILISAKHKDISQLESYMKKHFVNKISENEEIISNTRSLSFIKSAFSYLKDAFLSLKNGFSPDIVIVDLTQSWKDLKTITGELTSDSLLDTIFANFCLGK